MTVLEKRERSEKRFNIIFIIIMLIICFFVLRYLDRMQDNFMETGYLFIHNESK